MPNPKQPLVVLCLLLVVAAVVMGGGTRSGHLSDAALQIVSVPVLFSALWQLYFYGDRSQKRAALLLCAVISIPLAQIIPLPPSIWTRLPMHESAQQTFVLLGQPLPWLPISIAPPATVLSILVLLPPIALFLGVLCLEAVDRRKLSLLFIVLAVGSVFLGLLQVVQGPESSLRFFQNTNINDSVGFFANRNHYAALLYCTVLSVVAWTSFMALRVDKARQRYLDFNWLSVAAGGLALIVLFAGLIMARSRTGIILSMIAIIIAMSMTWSRSPSRGLSTNRVVPLALAVAVLVSMQYAVTRMSASFAVDPMNDLRWVFAANTLEAAKAFMPFGSGVGTFRAAYGMFENKEGAVANVFANHAHNDILQLVLEFGVFGIIALGLLVVWVIKSAVKYWRQTPETGNEIDVYLMRACVGTVALLLAHSVTDYPLRSGALQCLFAFVCGMIAVPKASPQFVLEPEVTIDARTTNAHHASKWMTPKPNADLQTVPQVWPSAETASWQPVAPKTTITQSGGWQTENQWPDEWKKPGSTAGAAEVTRTGKKGL